MNAPSAGKAFACITCHQTEAFVAVDPTSNGLDATITDAGVGGITGATPDRGKFKVPSLRNIAIRPPYMHDGRFESLEEVVEFYNSGIQASPRLHPSLIDDTTGNPERLNLSGVEKTALVDFLGTLTDNAFLTDEKFDNPFDRNGNGGGPNGGGRPNGPRPPNDTWTPFYNLANDYYQYFASTGSFNYATAYYYYYRGLGDYHFHSAGGNNPVSLFEYYEGLGYFYYYAFDGTGTALYYFYRYYSYAYYYYFVGVGDPASANSYFDHYYSLALSVT